MKKGNALRRLLVASVALNCVEGFMLLTGRPHESDRRDQTAQFDGPAMDDVGNVRSPNQIVSPASDDSHTASFITPYAQKTGVAFDAGQAFINPSRWCARNVALVHENGALSPRLAGFLELTHDEAEVVSGYYKQLLSDLCKAEKKMLEQIHGSGYRLPVALPPSPQMYDEFSAIIQIKLKSALGEERGAVAAEYLALDSEFAMSEGGESFSISLSP